MKKLFFAILSIAAVATVNAQNGLEVSYDRGGQKVLKGFIDKKQLATDTAFAWYAQNQKGFTPAADLVQRYAAGKDSVNLIVFGGTWCGDTQAILPKFFALTEAAGIPDSRITLIGVDHNKKTLYNLSEAFHVVNVPTFIVMKNGKEVGRVVEYGNTGIPEKEVAQFISGAQK